MTTTPLPPFPRPSVFDPGRFGVAYSQAQMVDFATAARADLEAENSKLREALEFVVARFGPIRDELVFSRRLAIDNARAALESKP